MFSERNPLFGRFPVILCGVSIILLAVLSAQATPTGTTYTVCASGCDFSSIQAAIDAATSGDTISLAAETFTESFYVDDKALTIQGAGAENTVVQADNTPGTASDRVAAIYADAKVTLAATTIRYGVAPDPGPGFSSLGGGIYNVGELTLTYTIVTDNEADNGGGIFSSSSPDDPDSKGLHVSDCDIASNHGDFGGGIYNFGGSAIVQNSTIHGNQAAYGGGICSESDLGHDTSRLTVVNSTIAGNWVGMYGGGIYNDSYSVIRIDESTIEHNSANTGGGIYNHSVSIITKTTIFSNTARTSGGGLYNYQASTKIKNSTITQNKSAFLGGGISNWWKMYIVNCTIAENTTGENYGGGIHNTGIFVEISNSILAGNYPAEADCDDPDGTVVDLGYNLVQDGSCISHTTSFADDPKLGPLQDNGGRTYTHALLEDSPAIDAIPIHACAVAEDQRGISRPQGDACDIGAFEWVSSYSVFLPLVLNE